jgi:carboxylesterase type B
LSLLAGTKFNLSTDISTYPYIPDKLDPRTTEDCLFLDVIVPQKIFHRAQQRKVDFVAKQKLAPVMVWIYGGGFAEGDKTLYNPEGLIDRSEALGEEIVYVAMNYRVSIYYPVISFGHIIL